MTVTRKTAHVIIIGAGISGMYSAYLLKKAGIKFTILEARNRIGGRILTERINEAENLAIELGAEWIGKQHWKMIQLCKDLGLDLIDNSMQKGSVLVDGQYLKPGSNFITEKEKRLLHHVCATLASLTPDTRKELDKESFEKYLREHKISKKSRKILDIIESIEFGDKASRVSAYRALCDYIDPGSTTNNEYKVRGGNISILEKILAVVGEENLHLGSVVKTVDQRYSAEGNPTVTVTTSKGETFEGTHAICTLPAPLINKIQWLPKLKQEKKKAADSLRYSAILKTSVLFSSRIWKEESFEVYTNKLPHLIYHATKSQLGQTGVLTSYAVSDKARRFSRFGNRRKTRNIINVIKPILHPKKYRVIKTVSHYWMKDKYSLGAYACYGPFQWEYVRPLLQDPHLNVLFAGEHLGQTQGYMEGALESAEDATKYIKKLLHSK